VTGGTSGTEKTGKIVNPPAVLAPNKLASGRCLWQSHNRALCKPASLSREDSHGREVHPPWVHTYGPGLRGGPRSAVLEAQLGSPRPGVGCLLVQLSLRPTGRRHSCPSVPAPLSSQPPEAKIEGSSPGSRYERPNPVPKTMRAPYFSYRKSTSAMRIRSPGESRLTECKASPFSIVPFNE